MTTTILIPTAIRFVCRRPNVCNIQKPAARQPSAAPRVFRQYNTPILEPISRSDSVTARTNIGNVVPIRKQGTNNMAKDNPNRARVLTNSESGDKGASVGTVALNQSSITGIAIAQIDTIATAAP